jgi:putative lipoprotein
MGRHALHMGILAVLLAGCGAAGSPGGDALDGTAWILTEYNGTPVIAGSQVTIAFADGQVTGRGGCNSYGGGYTARDSRLSIAELASTAMACLAPGVMEQEAVVLGILGAAERYEISGGELRIRSAQGEMLTFAAQG